MMKIPPPSPFFKGGQGGFSGQKKQKSMPRISVIMRSYNNAGVIEETLTTLFAQRLPNFELINVDSGSTDGTVEIIKKFNSTLIQIPPSEYKPGRVLNRPIEKSPGGWMRLGKIGTIFPKGSSKLGTERKGNCVETPSPVYLH